MRKRSILWNALLLTGVNLLLRGVGMVFQVYLSRRIGAAGVGLLQLILTVETAAMTFGLSGARVAAMYLCAEEFGRRRMAGVRCALEHCLRYGLLCSCVTGMGLMLGSKWIAETWLHTAEAAGGLRLVALGLPVGCCSAVLSGYFTACGQVRRLVRVEAAERMVGLGITIMLLRQMSGRGAAEACGAVVLGGALTGAASCGVLGWMIWRDLRTVGGQKDADMGRRMRRLCLPLAASDYLRAGLRTVEQLLIPWGLMRAGGAYETALAEFGMMGGMVFPVLMFPAAILYALSDLLVPELARCRAEGKTRRIRQLTERCLRAGLVYAGAVSGGMFVLGEALGMALYGQVLAGRLLRCLAPMVLSLYMDAIVDGMLKGLGEQVACVRYNTITMAMDVALLGLFLPRFGMRAYLVSFSVTHLVNFALSLRRLLTVTAYRAKAGDALRVLLCTAAAAGLAGVTAGSDVWGTMLWRGAVFAGTFCGLLCLTGAMDRRDAVWLRQTLRGH